MIVVDASVVLDLLLGTKRADAVDERLAKEGRDWHAPHLLDLEVAQVLRRYVRTGEVKDERGLEVISDLERLPIFRYPHHVLLPRIWDLRDNATVYDAAYLALAEALDAPLLTGDRRLASVPGHAARVETM